MRGLGLGVLVFLPLGAAACESATNLDVAYRDPPPAVDGGDAASSATAPPFIPQETPPPAETATGNESEACPCDESQGLACCVSAKGATCTTDEGACRADEGAFYRCFRPDARTESACCWRGTGAGATTAYAADCTGEPSACAGDEDCAPGTACQVRTCRGVTVGACGREPPACPPGA